MTDEQIAEQILGAAEGSLQRFNQAKTDKGKQRACIAEFLSGANQAVNFLVRMDGSVTPQQVERALLIVGNKLGLTLERPKE